VCSGAAAAAAAAVISIFLELLQVKSDPLDVNFWESLEQ